MSHVLASLAVAAILGAHQAPDREVGSILDGAREALESLSTATYEASAEVAGETSRRITTGTVSVARFAYSDPIGGRVALRGEVTGGRGAPESFMAAYDGQLVRRVRAAQKRLLQGDMHFGGEALLTEGPGKSLILDVLLAEEPFAAERSARSASRLGVEVVEGVPCEVLAFEFEDARAGVTWSLAVQDHLPRRLVRRYTSARGTPVVSSLTLRNLQVNVPLDEATFAIEVPQGYDVEIVGKRPPPPLKTGDLVPDFTLSDGKGHDYTLSSLRGRLVLLKFWATWCGYCKKAMPFIQRLQDTHGGSGFSVLAINCRDAVDADPVGFVQGKGYTYTVLTDGSSVASQYRVQGIPHFYLVGPDGRLIFNVTGFDAAREVNLQRLVEQYLPGPK